MDLWRDSMTSSSLWWRGTKPCKSPLKINSNENPGSKDFIVLTSLCYVRLTLPSFQPHRRGVPTGCLVTCPTFLLCSIDFSSVFFFTTRKGSKACTLHTIQSHGYLPVACLEGPAMCLGCDWSVVDWVLVVDTGFRVCLPCVCTMGDCKYNT